MTFRDNSVINIPAMLMLVSVLCFSSISANDLMPSNWMPLSVAIVLMWAELFFGCQSFGFKLPMSREVNVVFFFNTSLNTLTPSSPRLFSCGSKKKCPNRREGQKGIGVVLSLRSYVSPLIYSCFNVLFPSSPWERASTPSAPRAFSVWWNGNESKMLFWCSQAKKQTRNIEDSQLCVCLQGITKYLCWLFVKIVHCRVSIMQCDYEKQSWKTTHAYKVVSRFLLECGYVGEGHKVA